MNDLTVVNKHLTTNVYNNLVKSLAAKNVKVAGKEIERLDEDYSYKILDNFKIDTIDEYLRKKRSEGRLTTVNIGGIRRITTNDDWEIHDTLYPVIRTGAAYEGTRRSRVNDAGMSGVMKNELIEIDMTNLIPNVIYFLENTEFVPEVYYSKFTESQIKDMEELFICLLSRTIIDVEKKRLKNYLKMDSVTERFYWKIVQMTPPGPTKVKHPNIMNSDIFDEVDVLLEGDMETLRAYVKSVLLVVTIHLIMRIGTHNDSGNRLRMMIRSISGYRLLVERDLGCRFDPNLRTKTNLYFEPKVKLLKTIHKED